MAAAQTVKLKIRADTDGLVPQMVALAEMHEALASQYRAAIERLEVLWADAGDDSADCLTAGCDEDADGACSRCGYRPSDLPAETTSTLTDKEQTMKPTRYECPYCHRDLVEVDNPLRREFRHRRGEEAQCPGPEPVEGGGDGG